MPSYREAWVLSVLFLAVGQFACGSSGGDGLIVATACTDTFTACGGDPTGTWNLSGVCIDGDLAAGLNSERTSACASQTTKATLKGSGSVMYNAATTAYAVVIYNATLEEQTTESISAACAADSYGVTTLDAAGCTQIATTLKDGDPEVTVSCALVAGNCNCTATIVHVKKTQNLLTLTGSNIVENDDSTYDFCVTDTKMVQKETVAGNVSVVSTFTKK